MNCLTALKDTIGKTVVNTIEMEFREEHGEYIVLMFDDDSCIVIFASPYNLDSMCVVDVDYKTKVRLRINTAGEDDAYWTGIKA